MTMEKNFLLSFKPTFCNTDDHVVRYVRQEPPAHYIFRIEAFSLLKDALASTDKNCIQSTEFYDGGYAWILSIYPNGNTKFNGDNHISAYLKLANKPKSCISVCAKLRFFLFNQLQDCFLTIEDLRERHFHAVRDEWGIPKLLPLSTFSDPTKGYLLDDFCIFGAEVYVLSIEPRAAAFSLLKGFHKCSHSWKAKIPSKFSNQMCSPLFTFEGYSWKFCVMLKEHDGAEPFFLSLVLESSSNLVHGRTLYSEFDFSVTDHSNSNKEWKEIGKTWYSSSSNHWDMSLPVQSVIFNETASGCWSYVTVEVNFKQVLMLKDFP